MSNRAGSPDAPYKSIAAAERDGFVRSYIATWEEGSEVIVIKGVRLQRPPSDAFTEREWAERGYVPRFYPSTSFRRKNATFKSCATRIVWQSRSCVDRDLLYRADQVVPLTWVDRELELWLVDDYLDGLTILDPV